MFPEQPEELAQKSELLVRVVLVRSVICLMKKSKPLVTMTYETLKDHPLIDKSTIGLAGSPTNILTSFTPPQKGAGMMLEGAGKETTDKLAGILAAKHII